MQSAIEKFKTNYRLQRRIIVVLFTIVPVALLLVFSYLPLVKMIQYSFTDWDGISAHSHFVGLQNYKTVLTNPQYIQVFKVSLYYFAVAILQLALAMLLAVVLSYKVKFPNLWKGLIFFPYLVNGVAIGFIFLYFYKQNGTLDTILNFFHLDSWIKLWLGNRSTNNWAIAMTSLWRYTGYNFLLFFGAIQSVDPEIYEAADMDGANKWQQFRYIMFPAIREIFLVNVILSVSGCLSAFDTPYIMTNGANGTSTFVIQTINTAFKFNKLGLASAMAIVLLIIIIIVTVIQRLVTREKD